MTARGEQRGAQPRRFVKSRSWEQTPRVGLSRVFLRTCASRAEGNNGFPVDGIAKGFDF